MVRFIIDGVIAYNDNLYHIYIPIWLDLLYHIVNSACKGLKNLHSNMVRFIICQVIKNILQMSKFTFQYG